MPVEADVVYKDRDTIVSELIATFQASLPDINLGADSVARIWIEVFATSVEGLFLANQLLHDDMFPQTANALALQRMGEYWGAPIKGGTVATGTLTFSGVGGTAIPLGMMVAAPSSSDEALRFLTTQVGTIPNPGIPTAPVAADAGAGSLSVGTFEYGVTFLTAGGETVIGSVSNALVLANLHQVNVTGIPLGGTGTTGRKLYRRKNGSAWGLVTTLSNNTVTVFADNVADASLGGSPPLASTAEQITLNAAGEDSGLDYNVGIGSITDLVDAITGVTTVTNPVAFVGGTDTEDLEVFRSRLLEFIQAPKSGSAQDLESWAESVVGVESATVFSNDNMGTPQNGHATVRLVGPGGTVPNSSVQAAVLAELNSHDLVNVTIHVGTFTAHVVNTTIDATPAVGFTLSDVTPSITAALQTYIDSVPVGGTIYIAGIVAALFGLPGLATVAVSVPSGDVILGTTEKASLGTVTVV